jgi:flagellar motor protein MotB
VPESDFEAWSLNILTEDHQIVKSFKGTGSPPVTLSWNGRGIKGIVEDGTYTCIFSFSDKVGNVLSTTPQKLIVQKTRIPILRIEEPETKIMITIIGKLFFKSGKVEIAPDAYQILHQVAEVIKKNLDKQIVINIEGHTDNKPISSRLVKKYPTNLALSEARAEAVRQYLVQQEGIPAQILKTIGYGDTRPVADNTTSQGRAKNRRVEIIEIRIITQEVELH